MLNHLGDFEFSAKGHETKQIPSEQTESVKIIIPNSTTEMKGTSPHLRATEILLLFSSQIA
jgi:hypothetical protein